MDNLWIVLVLITCLQPLKAQEDKKAIERRYACWGTFGPPVVSAHCPRDTTIDVVKAGLKVANHGAGCKYRGNDCGCLFGEAGCNMPNVRDLCMGRSACQLDVTQQYIHTDTCRGFTDYMYIDFRCLPAEKTSIKSICSNTEHDTQFGYIRGPSGSMDGRTQCDCTLTTSPYSELSMTLMDYHSGAYTCSQEKLIIQYGNQAQKYCSDGYEGAQKLSTGMNKVSLMFSTDGKEDAGHFWLKYQAEPVADIKVQCTYTVEPRTSRKQITRKTPNPLPRKPATLPPEPLKPQVVVEIEPVIDPETTTLIPEKYDKTTRSSQTTEMLDDDVTKSTPWWWRFTLRDKGRKKGSTTAFPPWFKEVEVTEFPAWIKKTVLPEDDGRVQKEKLIKNIHPHAYENRDNKPLLSSENKQPNKEGHLKERPYNRDLVHGDTHSQLPVDPQQARHPRLQTLPQQNLPSKYHAARQPGKFKFPHRSRFSKSYTKRSNFTYPHIRRLPFRSTAWETTGPVTDPKILYTSDPTEYPPSESTIKIRPTDKLTHDKNVFRRLEEKHFKRRGKQGTDNFNNRNKNSHDSSVANSNPESFVNDEMSISRRNSEFLPIPSRYKNNGNNFEQDYEYTTSKYENGLPKFTRYKQNSYDNFDGTDERRSLTTKDLKNSRRFYKKEKNNNFIENTYPTRLKDNPRHDTQQERDDKSNKVYLFKFRQDRPRQQTNEQMTHIRSDFEDNEFTPTKIPKRHRQFDLLPNSRVTQLANIFRPNTIHTDNLAKIFGSKKTQLTLLEPTSSGLLVKRMKTFPPSSRFTEIDHTVYSIPSGAVSGNIVTPKPTLSNSLFKSSSISRTQNPTSEVNSNKSAKNRTYGSESIASRSRSTNELAKLPGLPYSVDNAIRNAGSPTTTVIAACVIGSILLIIIIGIVVRFVINRADPNHSIRQHHKKECIVRRNQRERGKSFA